MTREEKAQIALGTMHPYHVVIEVRLPREAYTDNAIHWNTLYGKEIVASSPRESMTKMYKLYKDSSGIKGRNVKQIRLGIISRSTIGGQVIRYTILHIGRMCYRNKKTT